MKRKKELRDQLRESSKKIGQLLPVIESKDGETIDGHHRQKADRNWKKVRMNSIDTEEKKIIARLALNWTRRKIKREEITREFVGLCNLHPEWKGHYSQVIVEITGYDVDTIEGYLPPEFKQKRERRIPPLSSSDSKEYAKRWFLKYGREVFPTWYEKFEKHPMASDVDRGFAKYPSNVWEASPERPKGYGDANFHGNTSPELAREIIVRYTKQGDLVLDNVAGSGTMLDICRKFNRECLSYDLSPSRHEIIQGDARNLPIPDNHIDFAFSHFPYGDMVKYSELAKDLSTMSQDDFLEESRKVMLEVHRVLEPGHYYAVLIGDQRKDKQIIDWSAEFSRMGKEIFTLHDKIIWHAKGQTAYNSGGLDYDLMCAQNNFCRPTFDTLLIFKK